MTGAPPWIWIHMDIFGIPDPDKLMRIRNTEGNTVCIWDSESKGETSYKGNTACNGDSASKEDTACRGNTAFKNYTTYKGDTAETPCTAETEDAGRTEITADRGIAVGLSSECQVAVDYLFSVPGNHIKQQCCGTWATPSVLGSTLKISLVWYIESILLNLMSLIEI